MMYLLDPRYPRADEFSREFSVHGSFSDETLTALCNVFARVATLFANTHYSRFDVAIESKLRVTDENAYLSFASCLYDRPSTFVRKISVSSAFPKLSSHGRIVYMFSTGSCVIRPRANSVVGNSSKKISFSCHVKNLFYSLRRIRKYPSPLSIKPTLSSI